MNTIEHYFTNMNGLTSCGESANRLRLAGAPLRASASTFAADTCPRCPVCLAAVTVELATQARQEAFDSEGAESAALAAGHGVYFCGSTDTVRLCPASYCLVVQREGRWLPPSRKAWADCREGESFPAPDGAVELLAGFSWDDLAATVAANETSDGATLAAALVPVVAKWARQIGQPAPRSTVA